MEILQHLEFSYLDNLPLNELTQIFYQHDGAPPHNGHLVNNLLQSLFAEQWIANNGPYLWPPRSPDLSVLDFFIWGIIKNEIYSTAVSSKEDCILRVRESFRKLDPASIRRATHEGLIRRCEKCLAAMGRQFEHLGR